MNILIINVDGNPQYIGGIKRICVSLAKQWIQHGLTVCFVCVGDSEKKFNTVAGIPQVHLPEHTDILSEANKSYLLQLVKERNIDVLFNPFMDCKEVTRLCFEVSKSCHVKLLTAWHFSPAHFIDIVDNSFFIRYKNGNILRRYLIDSYLWIKWKLWNRQKTLQTWSKYFDECIKNSDAVVFLSNRFLPIVDRMVGYHSNKVLAINNPNSFEEGVTVDCIKKEKIVLWCGRLGYDMKRTDKMLSIWKRISSKHKDWKLVICGSGNVDYFNNVCDKYHIENVAFLGFVNMEDYYAKASILCNTSVTEGWGLVLVEAMQYGCVPVVFDSYASVHDIIDDDENGFIIPAFDEKEYARKQDLLMSEEDLRMRMAAKGRESTKRFEPNEIAQQWIELFESLESKNLTLEDKL